MMRWDDAPREYAFTPGAVDDRLTTLADIYPTILEAAGLPLPAGSEGQSLLSRDSGPSQVLLSAWRNRDANNKTEMPPYCGLQTERWLYVRYSTGFEELYDLRRDSALMRNLATDRGRSGELAQMRRSTREKCSPTPPDFNWSS